MDSEDGQQTANKKFQMAAGIFSHLKGITCNLEMLRARFTRRNTTFPETVRSSIAQDPTPDLMPDTLGVLSTLCLAQAQEMVVLKVPVVSV